MTKLQFSLVLTCFSPIKCTESLLPTKVTFTKANQLPKTNKVTNNSCVNYIIYKYILMINWL